MDMFIYGCPYVIRYFSILNHSFVLYDLKNILLQLSITQQELREICILSGTDYNSLNDDDKNTHHLQATLKWFKKYLKQIKNNKIDVSLHFYHWLLENTTYIQDYDLLVKICDMFDVNKKNINIDDIRIVNGPIINQDIEEILKTDGFLFPIHLFHL